MVRTAKIGDVVTLFHESLSGWMYATRLEGALYVDEMDRELEFQSPPNPQDCLFRLHPQHRFAALKVPHTIPSAGEAVGQFLRCTGESRRTCTSCSFLSL